MGSEAAAGAEEGQVWRETDATSSRWDVWRLQCLSDSQEEMKMVKSKFVPEPSTPQPRQRPVRRLVPSWPEPQSVSREATQGARHRRGRPDAPDSIMISDVCV